MEKEEEEINDDDLEVVEENKVSDAIWLVWELRDV